jgi:uncharacterized cupin superfamily protein
MAHPNVTHLDAVEPEDRAGADIDRRRWRLGAAAGARDVGLSRYVVAPGARMMPVHVHADEEEICVVLAGHGVSYEDGRAFTIGTDDTLVYRAGAPAHTLVAGPDGLEVLFFGSGSPTGLTWLPRARVMWAGAHWLPVNAPHPFAAEVQAGSLAVPATDRRRPPTIVSLADVDEQRIDQPGFTATRRDLGTAAGSVRSGLRRATLDPGMLSAPPHLHTMEEEILVVLEGEGTVLLGEDEEPVGPGSVVARPPDGKIAHALRAGADPMTYLAYGTRVPGDVVFYPRSQKLLVAGVAFRIDPVGYWDGEG